MTWTNASKPTTSYTTPSKPGEVGYITTDSGDYVLLGVGEAETLIWRSPSSAYTNLAKPS